ncbi:MAG: pseudouridine synthase [Candidatus Bathyarchaeota archaeon]|nr:pseudouridine synthase [Candidatus Bathyarchaeota archaeon]
MFSREFTLERIRKIADYQFGKDVGEHLFPDNVEITFSKGTGRIRHIYLNGVLLATLNPTTGLFTLTIEGARRVFSSMRIKRLWVKIRSDAVPFVEGGGDVFAKHVICSDEEILPGEEVIVIDDNGDVVAVGRAVLSGAEMKAFKRGVAVKVRSGKVKNKRGKD